MEKFWDLATRIYERLHALVARAWANALKITSAIIVGLIVWQGSTTEVVIDLIDVPTEASSKGVTPKLVTARLLDHVNLHRGVVPREDHNRALRIRQDSDRVDIEMPGGGSTVQAMVRFMRHFAGFEDLRISGELTTDGQALALRLRGSRPDRFSPVHTASASGNLEELLAAAAKSIVTQLDPVGLAMTLAFSGHTARVDEARALLRTASLSGNRQERAEALLVMGYLLEADGKREQAAAIGEEVAALSPGSARAAQLIAAALLATEPEAALAHARNAIRWAPSDPDGYELAARALSAVGRRAEALAQLERGIRDADLPFSLFSRYADEMRRDRRMEDFVRFADQERAKLSGWAGFHFEVGRCLSDLGRHAEALARLRLGVELAQSDAMRAKGHRLIGDVHADRRAHAEAIAAFRSALAIDPDLAEAKAGLAASAALASGQPGAVGRMEGHAGQATAR